MIVHVAFATKVKARHKFYTCITAALLDNWSWTFHSGDRLPRSEPKGRKPAEMFAYKCKSSRSHPRSFTTVLGVALASSSTCRAFRPSSSFSPGSAMYPLQYGSIPCCSTTQQRRPGLAHKGGEDEARDCFCGNVNHVATWSLQAAARNERNEGPDKGKREDNVPRRRRKMNRASSVDDSFQHSNYGAERDETGRSSFRHRLRRRLHNGPEPKLQTTRVVIEPAGNTLAAGAAKTDSGILQRARRLPRAALDVVWGIPVRFVYGRAAACRTFLTTRRPIDWACFWMATYITTTSVVPRLDGRLSYIDGRGNNVETTYRDKGSGLEPSDDFTSEHSSLSRLDRQQVVSGSPVEQNIIDENDFPGDNNIRKVVDDHAEGLWRDSPIARAAGIGTPAGTSSATSPSEETDSLVDPPCDSQSCPAPHTQQQSGIPPLVSVVPDAPTKGLSAPDRCPDVPSISTHATPDLHTHTALGDLEIEAEKALDGVPGKSDENPVSSDLHTHTDLGDLELAAEKALDVVPVEPDEYFAAPDRDEPRGERGVRVNDDAEASVGTGDDAIAEFSSNMEDERSISEGNPGETLPADDRALPTLTPVGDSMRSTDAKESKILVAEDVTVTSAGATEEATVPPTGSSAFQDGDESGELAATSAPNTERGAPTPPLLDKRPSEGDVNGDIGKGAGPLRSSSFVATAARAVSPAVCRIDMERLVSTRLDTPFPPPDVEVGQGSGVVFSSDEGLVLTNAHVVAGARKVTVTLTDGRKFIAEVKGADEFSDLAVLQIDKSIGTDQGPLPAAKLGNSQDLQVGDWVIAVGNPVGLDSTVTLGIVSSLKRSSHQVGFPDRKVTFIQTDAAINPGNSGGPLVNEFGEVVGINTAIRAHAEGIGFAIPIDKAKSIMYELAEGKHIEHAYIGVHMSTITPDFAMQNNRDPGSRQVLPEINGAVVVRVLPETPAADAGLRLYDVVIEMGGRRVLSADDAKQIVDTSAVGDTLSVKVIRGADTTLEVEMRPTDMTEHFACAESASEGQRVPARPYPRQPPPAFPWESSSVPGNAAAAAGVSEAESDTEGSGTANMKQDGPEQHQHQHSPAVG